LSNRRPSKNLGKVFGTGLSSQSLGGPFDRSAEEQAGVDIKKDFAPDFAVIQGKKKSSTI